MLSSSNPVHRSRYRLLLIAILAGLLGTVGLIIVLADAPVPILLRDIYPGSPPSNPSSITTVGNSVFFSAQTANEGEELWKSDGTELGTQIVRDIIPGTGQSNPRHLAEYNGLLYFAATDGSGDEELWVSDGDESGTQRLININNNGSSTPTKLKTAGALLYFTATDGNTGIELWSTDGSQPGTLRVKDINPGSGGSNPTILTPSGGRMFFRAFDGASNNHGEELWVSDGTEGGTYLVRDIRPGLGSSEPTDLADANGVLFFSADDGQHGRELWLSDGTQPGTVLVKDIVPGAQESFPNNLTYANGLVFFSATDGANGIELWASDGTSDGTYLVKDINPGAQGSAPSNLFALNNRLYFSATDGVHGRELWISDGTEQGTYLLKDIRPGVGSSTPTQLKNINNLLIFRANDGIHDVELWRSNGTTGGTALIADVNPGGSSNPGDITGAGTTAFFSLDDGTSGRELWSMPLDNDPPTANAGGPYSGSEGQAVTLQGSGSDPDDATLSYLWQADPPLCQFSDPELPNAQVTCADDGSYTLTLTVFDWWAETDSSQAQITLTNVPPSIDRMAVYAVRPGAPSQLAAAYSDPGSADTHTATINWGDGTAPQAAVIDAASNTLSGEHVYNQTGTYTVTVQLSDDDGGQVSQQVTIDVDYRLTLPLMRTAPGP